MLHQLDENGVYARIYAAPMRRLFAYVMLLGLGALLLWLVFTAPPTAGWALLMVLIALGALYLAERMRRATATVLELTADELRDSTGRVLARVEDIEKIDRGVFAFKPSNGFVLKTKESEPAAWAPGLWWRIGRRVGVGGVVPSAPAKYMAEVIGAWIETRG